MKTDLKKQTKYFRYKYNSDLCKFELEEIPFNKENWFYVQLDATIRTTFLKFNCPLPKYVILEELTHCTVINIFRSPIKNEKDLFEWKEKYIYVYDELKHQAEVNSSEFENIENWTKYEIKIL